VLSTIPRTTITALNNELTIKNTFRITVPQVATIAMLVCAGLTANAAIAADCKGYWDKQKQLWVSAAKACKSNLSSSSSANNARSGKQGGINPGHYMSVGHTAGNREFARIAGNQNFVGVKKRYRWKDLEKARGVYDFSRIERDLWYLQSIDKRLWITVLETTNGGNKPPLVPQYITNDSAYGCGPKPYGVYSRQIGSGGWIPCWWNSNTTARLKALYVALGERFNKEPYFEGLNLHETAYDAKAARKQDGYSSSAISSSYVQIAIATKNAFPNKIVQHMINYAPFSLESFSSKMLGAGIGLGGPDTENPNRGSIGKSYDLIKKSRDKVPNSIDVQWNNYSRGLGANQLLDIAIKHIEPWYVFWMVREP
jgi:hypothetical protein